MQHTDKEIASLIFTSTELARHQLILAKKYKEEPGLTWGIHEIDDRDKGAVLPMRGGDVALIVGRPGDGKTTILSYHALREIGEILKRGKEAGEAVVYVTWEGTVDAIYSAILASMGDYTTSEYLWGDVDLENVAGNAARNGAMPLIMLGFSTMVKQDKPLVMTLDDVFMAIRMIQDGEIVDKRKVTLLLMDYLQIIPEPSASNRVDQVSKAIVGAKNLGMDLDIPSYLGAQAGRDVDQVSGYNLRLAEMHQVQWSSQAEQHCDKFFSITRPIRYMEAGTELNLGKYKKMLVTEELLVMAMRKQRGEKGRGFWPLHLSPELLQLTAMEVQVAKKFGSVWDE
jgi:hypothetical protein